MRAISVATDTTVYCEIVHESLKLRMGIGKECDVTKNAMHPDRAQARDDFQLPGGHL